LKYLEATFLQNIYQDGRWIGRFLQTIVLLHAGNARAHSDQILTHKRLGTRQYNTTRIMERQGSFVQDKDDPYPTLNQTLIAPAYQLTDTQLGRTLKHLVSAHRMKKYKDIAEFNERHPP